MTYDFDKIKDYIIFELFNWKIKDDAPDWAKEEFKKMQEELKKEK